MNIRQITHTLNAMWAIPLAFVLTLVVMGVMEVRNICDWISYWSWNYVTDDFYYREPWADFTSIVNSYRDAVKRDG